MMMMLMGQSLGQVLPLLLVAAVSCVAGGALRPARDVAHLPLEYLPPVELPPLPSREYLPPVERHAASLSQVLMPPRDYLPPSNEYLPPAETTAESISEAETTEAPLAATTELPTTEPEQPETTTAQPEESVESEASAATEAPATHEDIVEDIVEPAGVLRSDGYHYAAPQIIPDLAPTSEAYLPPLVDNAVVAEPVPEGDDQSAALLDDGYHYRAIRRLRL